MEQNSKNAGSRTLRLSVLMSAPGPLVVGLGLLAGRSATQLADFVRRSAELLAIVAAWLVYERTARAATEQKARLERGVNRFVGCAMCLSGAAMLLVAALTAEAETGNVIPGLTIAVLGVVANTLFWRRYARLSRQGGGAILAVQSRLYRAKALVDGCVTAALLTVALAPGSPAALWLDKLGSAVVAVYLIRCGLRTVRESRA
ncbi:MAG: cation transporter [Oscillospiraceae bacterium]|nr:cation transporter [Oscillospiraceae bacterium]